MKTKLIAGAAFAAATMLAMPAFAQSSPVRHWNAYRSYGAAQVVVNGYGRPLQSLGAYNTNSRFAGADPDPNVREMIERDHVEQDNGGF